MTCLSHGLKAHPSVSQSESTKIELPLDISEEQRHFLNSLTAVLVAHLGSLSWTGSYKVLHLEREEKKMLVMGDQGTTFS